MRDFRIFIVLSDGREGLFALLNPFASIHEGFHPRSDLVGAAWLGVSATLPGEARALEVRHHSQMATISRADTCHAVIATVGIARVFVVAILQDNVVLVLCFGQGELAFAVCHPDAEAVAAEAAEHHAAVGRDSNAKESTLKLVAVVVKHTGAVLVFGVDEVEFHHQLATVANA